MYIGGIFTYTCIIALRLSLCLLFLRITTVLWQRWSLYGVAIVTTFINSINLFRLNIFYCYPVQYYWEESLDYPASACVSATTEDRLFYAQYSISIAADWATSFLPLFILKNSKMSTKAKVLTCCLLGLGIFASGASFAVVILSKAHDTSIDYFYNSYPIFVSQMSEPFIGMIAASLATYRPLLRSVGTLIGSSHSARESHNIQRPDVSLIKVGFRKF